MSMLDRIPARWKALFFIIAALILLLGIFIGYSFKSPYEDKSAPTGDTAHPRPEDQAPRVWTCSMHPQVRLPEPGLCPICNMELIPVADERKSTPAGPRELVLSEAALALMELETAFVERKLVETEVRMVGMVDYDETRLRYITAWAGGRLDRLFVDYTGIPVQKGDHMVELYSPELYAAQEELIQAVLAVQNLKESDSSYLRESARETVEAAREKLRLLGLLPDQIEEIIQRKEISDHLVIYAPVGGIVIHKNAQEGMYVETGTRIYTIADLSQVWVRLDAYESDLAWLRYGQDVEFTVEAYQGEVFHGTIFFIDPVLTKTTRTVKVRVNAPNPELRLKPGMFVKAKVKATVAAKGRVMDPALAGKWICPMHPEVIEESAGACPVCGMPLVRAESLGYEPVDPGSGDKPLVVPASAVLLTGARAVVYVEVSGREGPTYQGKEILLGPRAGDYYLVREGLDEGERVVTQGNFKIDAELQIRGKPSMMSPEGGVPPSGHLRGEAAAPPVQPPKSDASLPPAPAEFRKQLAAFMDSYFAVQETLAADDFELALEAWRIMADSLDQVDMRLLDGKRHEIWMRHAAQLQKIIERGRPPEKIESMRRAFALLSEETAAVLRRFSPGGMGTLHRIHCPMAFDDRGAAWIQKDKMVRNPYFGAAMFRCGEVVEEFPSGPYAPAEENPDE